MVVVARVVDVGLVNRRNPLSLVASIELGTLVRLPVTNPEEG